LVGLDLGFFENRLSLIADYYQKTTSDMLLALEIPNYIGYDNPNQNTGNMYTKGWEIEAIYNNRVGEFNYSLVLIFLIIKPEWEILEVPNLSVLR
jgi:outer membrane receptor protein involved in Fe transport